MHSFKTSILQSGRLFPKTKLGPEQTIALSLLDATTLNFAHTCVVWLCEAPDRIRDDSFYLADHLRESLRITLDAYPQWCGQIYGITTLDGTTETFAAGRPRHTRRLGRFHVHYGTPQDPGVEFIVANSTATLDMLSPAYRMTDQPLWNRQNVSLKEFVPSTPLSKALQPVPVDKEGIPAPLLAVQMTSLACGGFILGVNSVHPMADVQSLVHFVKDWASVSRSVLSIEPLSVLRPQFKPELLDSLASGDIEADTPDSAIIKQAESMPLHRYDWWIPSPGCPWPIKVPDVLAGKEILPAGKPMPWSDWDVTQPVSHYVVHLNQYQVDLIVKCSKRSSDGPSTGTAPGRLSQHDAILAHIWSCINRARKLEQNNQPVHCNLVLGVRPAFKLSRSFMGSPVIMINIELPVVAVTATLKSSGNANTPVLQPIAQHIRQTISQVNQPALLAAHLHSLAYEDSPQRIWQAFLGRRHILVTTWARAGLYEVDFGLRSSPMIRYADGMVPDMDGNVLIKEAPPLRENTTDGDDSPRSWTRNGVDISLRLRTEDMNRLVNDPLLFP
ncbi:hypothetical protein MauCBS54593_001538 [Microsporum audouinii]